MRIIRRIGVALALTTGMCGVIVAVAGAASTTGTQQFTYTGGEQIFSIPAGVTALNVIAIAGRGAEGAYGSSPGPGARATGTISVTPGATLYVEVGASGSASQAGFNGGGSGGVMTGNCGRNGGAGGGATDIRTMPRAEAGSDTSRLLVAGGGGGGGSGYPSGTLYVVGGGAGGSAGTNGSGGAGIGGASGTAGASADSSGQPGAFTDCSAAKGTATGGGGGGGGAKGGGGGGWGSQDSGDPNKQIAGGGGGGGGGTSMVPTGGSVAVDTSGVPSVVLTWSVVTPDPPTSTPTQPTPTQPTPAPDTTSPTVALTAPTATWSLGSSTTVAWSSADTGGSSLAKFQVRYQRASYSGAFGAWAYPVNWQVLAPIVRQVSAPLAAGYTYCYSVRAFDNAGNASVWSTPHCTRSPLDDRALKRGGQWTPSKSRLGYRGTLVASKVPGSILTLEKVLVSRVALIATTCPACGAVMVRAGPTTTRVSLRSPTIRTRHIIALPITRLQRARVVITVVTKGKQVVIDGLGVSRR